MGAGSNSTRGVLGFCGTMLYQVARVKLNAAGGIHIIVTLTLTVLFGIVSRREGRGPTVPAYRQFGYAFFFCPCAMSWLVRVESHVSAGHSRSWSLLSSTGTNENAVEVAAVHV